MLRHRGNIQYKLQSGRLLNPNVRKKVSNFSFDKHLKETAWRYPKGSDEAKALSAARITAAAIKRQSHLPDEELAMMVFETIRHIGKHDPERLELLLQELERLGVLKKTKG